MSSVAESLSDRQHALYRFFDGRGVLLYVGITCHPSRRWERHRERPWWTEVARIEVESLPDRASALAAERRAIIDGAPRYNVKMNRRVDEVGGGRLAEGFTTPVFKCGDAVALGLIDGRCPIGIVAAVDSDFIRLDLFGFVTFEGSSAIYLRDEVMEVLVARVQDAEEVLCQRFGHDAILRGFGYKLKEIEQETWHDMRPLERFQESWQLRHRNVGVATSRTNHRSDET